LEPNAGWRVVVAVGHISPFRNFGHVQAHFQMRDRLESLRMNRELLMISLLIGILIICVVGAICFVLIEKFVGDRRLANLLKLLVVLVCLGAILQRVLIIAGVGWV
jgi:hypothetical protein